MAREVRDHRAARKEFEGLPVPVRQAFQTLLDGLAAGLATPAGWREQISCSRRPRRTIHIGQARHGGVDYRVAWEHLDGDRVLVWMYGPHEGFYASLKRRAGCGWR